MSDLTYTRFPSPCAHRVRPLRWNWAITDGLTGPVLASGHTLSEWGALRKIERALPRCVQRVNCAALHPLTRTEATQICACLADAGIRITIRLSDTVDIYGPVSTEQEVTALVAVLARTDAPVHYHAVVGS